MNDENERKLSLKKRLYKVLLNGREDEWIEAQRYRKEADQYVFENDGDEEVQFFDASSVLGITVVKEDASQPDD